MHKTHMHSVKMPLAEQMLSDNELMSSEHISGEGEDEDSADVDVDVDVDVDSDSRDVDNVRYEEAEEAAEEEQQEDVDVEVASDEYEEDESDSDLEGLLMLEGSGGMRMDLGNTIAKMDRRIKGQPTPEKTQASADKAQREIETVVV